MAFFKYDGSVAVETAAPVVQFYGTPGADVLSGTSAAEGFWGGPADVMSGGAGDDSYWLKSRLDRVVEGPAGGVDKITAWHSVTLADHPYVENLSVSGDRLYAAGNALDNIVEGGPGGQQVYGGFGQDVLIGGAGADVFIVHRGEGNDVIQDFNAAEDKVRLKAGLSSFAQVQARLSQAGTDVKLDLGGGDGLIFRNLSAGQLTAANFQLELDPAALGARTFGDEFSGALSLWDPESNPGGVWRPDYGYQGPQGVGSYTLVSNDEKQIYTSPYFRDHNGDFAETPFSQAGGVLTITARASANPEIFGYGYTSGLISTKPSFAQTYGYFEMRADLPDAAGAWPAFWLLPADGSWPPELDVMEALTHDPRGTWTTQHSSIGGHASSGQLNYTPDTADGFHTYGALWGPGEIVWYVDNVEVFRSATPADMHKPMFMIANLALGGWGGAIDGAALPAEFRIDYIRAYALGDAPAAPPSSGGGYGGLNLVAPAEGSFLQGGGAADTLQGGGGSDTLRGGDGADLIYGGDSFDDTHGNWGEDTIYGGGGGDWVVGGQGNDRLFGEDGGDAVLGNLGNDTLDGGAGNDVVRGGQGHDLIQGGDGDDFIAGDRGDDTLSGGAGADVFHSFQGAGLDRILDFNAAEGDRVQVLAGTPWSVSQVGADTVVTLGAGDAIVLVGVSAYALPEGWIFAA
ncbi:endo-1,3-1,4-beta glycanase [Phenylobacterium zucineum HLK1]|uniref:Endo-1,3-1,4-beta glycanase n=1 Tax=Phenylobacterium zucineum (strain HLK1) TaxID=450851 RepID=B4R936_PHEZH|nr:family 16 glycosylhydrolase [Phenylobacterium zucineum]ACG77706.1 endo-1,3-1,4-beta glycanase [Phenylobacterium zucineum HLK1]